MRHMCSRRFNTKNRIVSFKTLAQYHQTRFSAHILGLGIHFANQCTVLQNVMIFFKFFSLFRVDFRLGLLETCSSQTCLTNFHKTIMQNEKSVIRKTKRKTLIKTMKTSENIPNYKYIYFFFLIRVRFFHVHKVISMIALEQIILTIIFISLETILFIVYFLKKLYYKTKIL